MKRIWKVCKARRLPAVVAVLAVLLCSFLLTEAAAVFAFNRMYARFLADEQSRFLRAINTHLSEALTNARSAAFALEGSESFSRMFRRGDRGELLEFLEYFCGEVDISYVNLVDSEGNIVLRSYQPDDYSHDSIYYQSGVQNALDGERFSCFERATVVKASARATAPIWGDDGEIIGAVVAVFRFDTNEWADELKDRYGVEFSIFSEEDGCISTTVTVDGERGLGERVTPAAAEAVYRDGTEFSERDYLFGTLYDSLYIPIKNPLGGTFVALCVSMPAALTFHETFVFTLTCGVVAVASLIMTALVLTKQTRSLTKAVSEANRANSAKSDFLARMSHEIRTPLNAVIGMTELILREDVTDVVRRNATVAKQAGKTLLSVINDILDISKIESGKMELVCVDYDVSSVISDVVSMARVRVGDKPIEIATRIEPSFPAQMYGDETRVRQILMNLMGNAVKYTNEGSITLSGVFNFSDAERKEGRAVFSVSDTGIGIREGDIKKLFGAFSQVDTKTNRKVEGTGLGLTITKSLTEMMGGSVSIESEYGKGSVFTARIGQTVNDYRAIGDVPAASVSVSESNHKIKAVKFHAPTASVLVVDDVEANLLVAAGLLSPYQVRVDCASNGADAIAMVEKNAYDFVLMDHMMPEMDGIETTKRIRELKGERLGSLPVIALTANAVTGMREMFLSNGFNGFITKPIDPNELNSLLETWTPSYKREYIDVPTEKKDDDAPFIKGIDVSAGLARCGGRKAVYAKILRSFAGELTAQTAELRQMWENERYNDFAKLIHTIKGVAGNVGANDVFETAKWLEAAEKEGDRDTVKSELPAFIIECETVAKSVIDGSAR